MTQMNELLHKEIEQTRELLQVLQQEHAALQDQDMDQLQSLAVHKQQLVTEIEAMEAQRSQGSNDHLGNDEQPLHTLKQLAQECQQQNIVNGAIIQAGYQFTLRALSALRGQDSSDNAVYDTKGQTAARLHSVSLAKA